VIIRGSVNINAGAETKLSTIIHGLLLLVCVALMPAYLNQIPLSSLAAILLLTGFKLASPKLFQQMWSEGRYQFLPFILTLISIVLTDLLIGILIGLAISLLFILNSNLRRPLQLRREKHVGGEVLHIELANQVSFLTRPTLERTMREAPAGSRILLDARRTDYIDPDILSLIREFKDVTAPIYNIQVGLLGFRSKYNLKDSVETLDFAPQQLHERLTPAQVIELLAEGNKRFVEGHPLDRDLRRQVDSDGIIPRPMAAIFTGIDSRTPVEMIFDLSLGEAFVLRMPGNVVGIRAVGGLEFAVHEGAKLIVVMGHTKSRLIKAAIQHVMSPQNKGGLSGWKNLETAFEDIAASIELSDAQRFNQLSEIEKEEFVNQIVRRHVARTIERILEYSPAIGTLVSDGKLAIVAAMYDVVSGRVEFLQSVPDMRLSEVN
jgi:carbonic anhydrase